MSRQEAFEIINHLSDDLLQKVVDYVRLMLSQKTEADAEKLDID